MDNRVNISKEAAIKLVIQLVDLGDAAGAKEVMNNRMDSAYEAGKQAVYNKQGA